MGRTFLGPYNSGSPHFQTIESYAAINTCQAIYLVLSHHGVKTEAATRGVL